MTGPVTSTNFTELVDYLYCCERVAEPPPLLRRNALLGYFTPANAPSRPRAADPLLGAAGYAWSFGDLGLKSKVDIAPETKLPDTRPERIVTLLAWMKRFPAYGWLYRQAAVRGAHECFLRVKKRRTVSPMLSDDLAEFRFWRLAAWAAVLRELRHTPAPNATQRKAIEKAVRRLRQLCASTSLLSDAGMNWSRQERFRHELDALLNVGLMARKPRTDKFSADREYIEALTQAAWQAFRVAPPSILVALAALKVANPDAVAITKLVKKEANRLADSSHQ